MNRKIEGLLKSDSVGKLREAIRNNEVKTIESSGGLTIEGSDTITVTDIKGEDEVVTGKKISVTENLDLDCGDYA